MFSKFHSVLPSQKCSLKNHRIPIIKVNIVDEKIHARVVCCSLRFEVGRDNGNSGDMAAAVLDAGINE